MADPGDVSSESTLDGGEGDNDEGAGAAEEEEEEGAGADNASDGASDDPLREVAAFDDDDIARYYAEMRRLGGGRGGGRGRGVGGRGRGRGRGFAVGRGGGRGAAADRVTPMKWRSMTLTLVHTGTDVDPRILITLREFLQELGDAPKYNISLERGSECNNLHVQGVIHAKVRV